MSISAVAGVGFWTNRAISGRQNLQSGASAGQEASGATASRGADTKRVDAVGAFTELMKGTPEQRLFKAWLARHDLSQEQYDALPLDEKKKIDEAFRKELEDRLNGGAKATRSVDIVV